MELLGAFTLARFRTKFAHLVMKKNIFLNKNVLAYCEIAREIRKCKRKGVHTRKAYMSMAEWATRGKGLT
jgi:hypothetical protein